MNRLTFEGNFCDIAKCLSTPGGSFCENGSCTQKRVWERLKEYENTGVSPEHMKSALLAIGLAFADVRNTINTAVTALEELETVSHLDETERGNNGFGSSGR